jgi:hypothetical protein
MQVIHRITISSSPEIRAELATMAVVIAGSGLVTFELDESHDSWPRVRRWIATRRAVDVVRTEFSKQEIANAKWFELTPDSHHGYPQPDEDVFGYRQATYDLSEYCEQCGIGLKQNAPFQMKGEPKWGRNGILQLNWVFDEYFVTPEIWSKIFQPRGIECRLVVDPKGVALQSVVQLSITHESSVVTEGLSIKRCAKCGRVKYLPFTRGYFPALSSTPTVQMVKTREYFGDGASASRRILVASDLAHALVAERVRGASLRPVGESSTSVAT